MAFLVDRSGKYLTDGAGAYLTDSGGGHHLALSVVGSGVVAALPDLDDYEPGDAVVLTATPSLGHVLLYLSLDGVHFYSTALPVNIEDDMAVVAYFIEGDSGTPPIDRARCPFCHGTPGCVVCGGTGWVRG